MTRSEANKFIYKQAKWLVGKIPQDSLVYIHWKHDVPLVLPTKQTGFDIINTVSFKKILDKQCWLASYY